MRYAAGLVVLVFVAACGSTSPAVATAHHAASSPTASADRLPSPTPYGQPVAARVLPPATVLPVASLCTYSVYETADGNFAPQFCSDGSINVEAWRRYATTIGGHIMAAGRAATVAQIDAALKADGAYRPTNVEALESYLLAKAYYGWHYSPDPACEYIYKQAVCY